MSKLFFSNPKVSLSFPTTNLSYCYIKYSGNTVATSTVVNSGKITTGSYTSGDLSINTLYTFTLTPLGAGDVSGIIKTISVDTTPQVAGTKSNVKSTYEATRLQWSGTTYDNYTVTRSINNTNSYADISTNVKTNYYYDNDLSGNTFYYYYVKPYDAAGNQYQNATTLTIYTNVRAPTDMSYTFFDSSAVSVKWVTKNSFSTSYYNAAYAVNPSGVIISISGDIQSGTITGLTKNTTYTCYAQTYLLANSGTTVTATTASPYVGGNIALYNVSMDSITVNWSGTYYDRVDVSRRIGTLLPYTTICGEIYLLQKEVKYYCSFNTGDVNGQMLYDYATGSYDITCSVNPATGALSTTYYKYGTSSLYPAGTSKYFTLPSFTTNGSALTVMFYAYFTSSAATNDVLRCFDFGNGINGYNIQSWVQYTSSSTLSIQYNLNTGGTGWAKQFNYSYTSYTLGTWVNIAYVISGTNVYFYVNGTLVYTGTSSVFPDTVQRTSNRLGYSNWSETSATSAYMDEFYVFDSALSASKIQSYMTKTSLSTNVNSYVDGDISGNTTYYYYVTPKVSVFTGSASTVVSATTPVAYPTDVSAIFYDTSAIKLQFSTPKNTYTSVVYSAIANHSTLGYTTTVTGTSPIMITNLSSGTTYTCYIQVNLNGGTIGTSSGLSVTTTAFYPTITPFTWTTSNLSTYQAFTPGNSFMNRSYSQTGQYVYILPRTGGSASDAQVYKSSDYGKTFTILSNSSPMQQICCSSDGSIIWAHGWNTTNSNYIYYSSNYGSTWTSSAVGGSIQICEICCTGDGATAYISGQVSTDFCKITYSGGSFTKTSLGIGASGVGGNNYGAIACNGDGTKILVSRATSSYCMYSTNSGSSFTSITSPGTGICQVNISYDGTVMLIGTSSGAAYISTNTGSTWSQISGVTLSGTVYPCCNYNGQYILIGSSSSSYYNVSSNYGSSFTNVLNTFTSANVMMNYTGQFCLINGGNSNTFLVNGNYGYETYLDSTTMKFAFSMRLTVSTYTGAVVNIRRSSDNVTADFYADATQTYLTTGANGTGTSYASWIGANTGYVTKWYDQSGQGNHATNTANNTTQPNLALQNGKYVVQFNNSNQTRLTLTTSSQPNTCFVHLYNTNTNNSTVLGTPMDYNIRIVSGGTSITGTNSGDWYYNSGGTKIAYVNNVSTTTFASNTWQVASLSTTSPTWTSGTSFAYVGYCPVFTDRGFSGYMVEMICHNTAIGDTGAKAFYSNRLF